MLFADDSVLIDETRAGTNYKLEPWQVAQDLKVLNQVEPLNIWGINLVVEGNEVMNQ